MAGKATLTEQHLYGASRLGMIQGAKVVYNGGVLLTKDGPVYQNEAGSRAYEITNHLGNVNAVITDRKMPLTGGIGALYEAVSIQTTDYYPFGMTMPGRNPNPSGYRYAYNGMEVDNEIKPGGNSYTTEFRQFDPRLGRWLSLDPLMKMFPSLSPYCAFDNNPVYYIDPYGLSSSEDGGQAKDGQGDPPIKMGGERHYYADHAAEQSEMMHLPENPINGQVVRFIYKESNSRKNVEWTYAATPGAKNDDGTDQKGRWEVGRTHEVAYFSLEDVNQTQLIARSTPTIPPLNNIGLNVNVNGNPNVNQGGNTPPVNGGNGNPPNRNRVVPVVNNPPPVFQPVNQRLPNLPAQFQRGTSTLTNARQLNNALLPIARQLISNPGMQIIIRSNTLVSGNQGWNTMTLFGVTAGQLATNRNFRVRQMLIQMGVQPNQIITQLGSPTFGMNMTARLVGQVVVPPPIRR